MLDLFSWKTWVLILSVIIFIIWIFYGRQNHEFIGISPLMFSESREPQEPRETQEVPEPRESQEPAAKSIGEQLVYQSLQILFPDQTILRGYRPSFLLNPKTNRCLELDCYLPDIKLAIEYNGHQHYVFPNTFHKTKEEFDKQVERDLLKQRACHDNDILLISVPYKIDMGESKKVNREIRFQRIFKYLEQTIVNTCEV